MLAVFEPHHSTLLIGLPVRSPVAAM